MAAAMKSRKKPSSDVPIEVLNRQRVKPVDLKHAEQLARAVLDRIGESEATLTLTFIRDRQMRQLNRDYRGIDKPTDVLSFAYLEAADEFALNHEDTHLGDVVIAVDTAERYAAEQGITLAREIEWLVIHGTLHVAGYDHETDKGEMNRLEKRLRKQLLK
jgi:probable rRNA maturation factor